MRTNTIKEVLAKGVLQKIALFGIASFIVIAFFFSYFQSKNESKKFEIVSSNIFRLLQINFQVGDEQTVRATMRKILQSKNIIYLRSQIGSQQEISEFRNKVEMFPVTARNILTKEYLKTSTMFLVYPNSQEEVKITIGFENHIREDIFLHSIYATILINLLLILILYFSLNGLVYKVTEPFKILSVYIKDFSPSSSNISEFSILEADIIAKEFNSLQKELLDKNERLYQKKLSDKLVKQAAYNAHDYDPPFQALKSIFEEEQHSFSKNNRSIATKAITTMGTITQNLLNLNNQTPIENSNLYIIDLAVEISNELETAYGKKKGLTFKVSSDLEKDVFVYANRHHLKRAISNLLKNSCQAVDENTVIEIRIKEDLGKLLLFIEDYGKGIKESDSQKVFSQNFTTKGKEGHGHGLPQVIKYIKSISGEIEFWSESDRGTIFKIKLPISNESVSTPPSKEGKIDGIVIEDTDFTRELWSIRAIDLGLKLAFFDSFLAFEKEIDLFPKSIPITLDLNLKDGTNIDDRLNLLHNRGFTKVMVCTTGDFKIPEKFANYNSSDKNFPRDFFKA